MQLFKDVAAALPNAKLYGPDGVARPASPNPKKGGIPAAVGERVKCTVATLDAGGPTRREGQKFFKQYKQKYGDKQPRPVRDLRLRGDERWPSTRSSAPATKATTAPTVLKALFATKDRQSVLGTYSIDANGDTTLTDYGAVRRQGRQPDVRPRRSRRRRRLDQRRRRRGGGGRAAGPPVPPPRPR